MGLYHDPETGNQISTHSMLKTFRRCPKQAEYKYVRRLKPKKLPKPLKRGTWIHKLLEVDALGGDWREEHQRLSKEFSRMFDEERDFYGNLPDEIYRVMQAYFWHYKKYRWKVLEAEFTLECEFPDGTIFRCKIDLLVEDQFGLWIVDHKSHARLPDLGYRILDAQSADYLWCALRNKIPVLGHIWNYIRWKPPTVPQVLKAGDKLSRRHIETDYPTMLRTLKRAELPLGPYMPQLRHLASLQYRPGQPQLSPFFRRDILEKSHAMLKRVATEAYHTSRRMHEYPFDNPMAVERVIDRSCQFMCSYDDICAQELWGANSEVTIRRRYEVGDPMDYYNDDRLDYGKGTE